jgi:hypothetical protein
MMKETLKGDRNVGAPFDAKLRQIAGSYGIYAICF